MKWGLTAVVCWLTATTIVWAVEPPRRAPVTPAQADFFERRVRPILVEKCQSCHGPKKHMSGLRLDSSDNLLEGGDRGPAVVPGQPENSVLIKAVRRQGDFQMPPKEKLPPQAVADLTAWVQMGAPWPTSTTAQVASSAVDAWKRHWAFQPVRKPALPPVKDAAWTKTAVDNFILTRLEAKALTPSPAADRRTLIRRATFDLTGLPPTPDEVAAFEADTSPDAFARVVDRLLASPHYGERWGRYWLDVARYADTKGYVFFEEANYPWSYTYRDYVIRAFNDDLPYDRFILEQLAADRLPLGEDHRPLTALGFLTIGGRFMSNQHDVLDDRIDVVTRGLLGLTVTCARCHDHKFDPIPSKDYYSLYGVFASCFEPPVPPLFTPPPQTAAYEAFDKELKLREKKLTEFVQQKHAQLVGGARSRAGEYLLAAQALRDQPNTEEFMLIADTNDVNPTMVARWKVYLERTARTQHPVFVPWHAFAALPTKDFGRVAGKPDPAHPVNPLVAQAFAGKPPRDMAEVARRYNELLNRVEKLDPKGLSPAEQELRGVFHGPDAPPDVALLPYGDLSLLPDRASQAKLQELRKALETFRSTGPAAPPRAMVLQDLPTPYEPRVFVRGNPNNLGEPVPRRFPQVLAGEGRQPFKDGSGRLELARAIADPRNPLTARVLVNRVWLHHFGAGLVRTPGDFGLRSEPPSHPELLDWLAATFVEEGWSIKKLHRHIMLSAAYRQQSNDRAEGRQVDPENRLLWKMNRQRLDLEAMRDALLAVSGRLDRTVGGPSVQNTFGAGTRRTLYGFLDRLNVPGLYRTFDFPSPDATTAQRDTTTVAPQALFLMNNPFVLECARALVHRNPEFTAGKDVPARVQRLYRLLYGRAATSEELALGLEYLGNADAVAWERYAQALLLANEFAFLD